MDDISLDRQISVNEVLLGQSESTVYDKLQQQRIEPDAVPDVFQQTPTTKTMENEDKELKPYDHKLILEHATQYFNGNTLAASVWVDKYAMKDSQNNVYELTPDDMHHRLAREFARIEAKYPNPMSEETIFNLMQGFRYIIPQGSPMAGIGNEFQIASLSNCFVIGNGGDSDSYGGIMKIDQEQVQLMKRRGGVGHDLSHIRPKGTSVKNSALTSTGIVPFMDRYSHSTREVAQDGRRGALMLSISVKHPEVESFIDAKLSEGKVTGANVSVKITDEFMTKMLAGEKFVQTYPIHSDNPVYTQEIDPKKLWNKIIHNAWQSAEPGVLFWDTITRESVADCYANWGFRTISTNPCGEIPLCAYDSCRLIAINLYSYVKEPFTPNAQFDFDLFRAHVRSAQRMMDDLVDLELEHIDRILDKIDADPEEEEIKRTERLLWMNIKKKSMEGRRTGLGITAEGDMIAALGLRYGTDEATDFSVNVHKILAINAYASSVEMAKERGAFPVYRTEQEVNNPFINRLKEASPEMYEEMTQYGRRNIALLTIAPTGSVSICTQTSSGIEPVFMLYYKRRRKVNPNDKNVKVTDVDEVGDAWQEYNIVHPHFETWLIQNGYDLDEVKEMSAENLQALIAKSPYYKATSSDIDWVSKVKMQGAVQKWVDHSISVTVNLPADTKEDLVSQIYQTAWETGCKGMTIYREGSRSGVLVAKTEQDKAAKPTVATMPSRPISLKADVVRFQNDYEKWIAVVGIHNDRPYEIFTGKAEEFQVPLYVTEGNVVKVKEEDGTTRYDFKYKDKAGYSVNMEALSRTFDESYWNYAILISGILRFGVMPITETVNLIADLRLGSDNINTWKNGVVRALKRYIPDGTIAEKVECPECHEHTVIYKEGCMVCINCGHSKCG